MNKNVYGASRNHYDLFVAHMIRFYITCPDGFTVENNPDMTRDDQHKQQINYTNWLAVQRVWCDLDPEEQRLLTDIYRRKMAFPEAVKLCATTHNIPEADAWKMVYRVGSLIARSRGLI